MSETSALSSTNPNSSSCWSKVIESKWTDAALISSVVALLIIGLAASTGAFNAIGTTNAAYLSYGMYGGAALFLITEVIKIVVKYCQRINPRDPTVIPETRGRNESYVHALNNSQLTPEKGLELLNEAAKKGDATAVQNLLKRGVIPGKENDKCTIAWAIHAERGKPIEILRLLVKNDPECVSRKFPWGAVRTSPLHEAVKVDSLDIVNFLIDSKADLEVITAPELTSGCTPLLLALWDPGQLNFKRKLPNLDIIEALSKAGANPDAYPRNSVLTARFLLSRWERSNPDWALQNKKHLDAIKQIWN